jgi:hypothetical protein
MINATNNGTQRELIPAGNYVARCYQMLHIGTIEELILGEKKILNKVRIGWELPTETKVFDEAKGEQLYVISKEFTLSLNEKANLRKLLASWRGKDFSEDDARSFDITKLLGVPCMLNIIHKPSKDGTKTYQEVGSVSPMPKGMKCPEQVNKTSVLDYDNFDFALLESLPDFIKTKVKSSLEYAKLQQPNHIQTDDRENLNTNIDIEDLPF